MSEGTQGWPEITQGKPRVRELVDCPRYPIPAPRLVKKVSIVRNRVVWWSESVLLWCRWDGCRILGLGAAEDDAGWIGFRVLTFVISCTKCEVITGHTHQCARACTITAMRANARTSHFGVVDLLYRCRQLAMPHVFLFLSR